MNKLSIIALAAIVATGATAAQAATFDFSTPAAGWTVDRYAPATFQSQVTYGGRGNTLEEATSVADGASNRPAAYSSGFYNTQGRALDLAPGTTSMSIDLYIDPLYANAFDGQRLAGFWGVGVDGSNSISAYPIIELDKIGSALTLRGWDSNGSGGWFNLATTTTGAWDTLGISLNGSNIDYFLDGGLVGSVDSGGTVSLKSAILQTYNTTGGVVDAAHWSGGVPEPGTWAMMIVGLGALGATFRARRARQLHLA